MNIFTSNVPSEECFSHALVAKCTSRKTFEEIAQNCVHAASAGRNTNPGHDLQSSSEVMSTLPADATDCRRCFRDFRKEDRQWEATAAQLCPNVGNFKGEPDDPSLAPRDRLLRRASVCLNIPVSHICHHLARLLPLGWCSTVVVSCSTDLDPPMLVPGASKLEDRW